MIKTVLDTNILVSASFWKGNPYQITLLAAEGKIQLFSSAELMEEFSGILKRDFKLTEHQIQDRVNTFLEIITLIKPKTPLNEIKQDQTDNKILEAAIEAGAEYIVSGDRHILELKEFRGIKIVKPKQFMENMK